MICPICEEEFPDHYFTNIRLHLKDHMLSYHTKEEIVNKLLQCEDENENLGFQIMEMGELND